MPVKMSVQSPCLSLTCHLTTFPLSPVYLSSYVALKGITRGHIKPVTEVKHSRSPRLCRTITLTLSANDVICNPSGCCHFIPRNHLHRRAALPSGPRSRGRLPWLQFSSSLWSMQSKTSSQRQRRGMQCARFRQRNSSSRHSFTQPI